VNSLKNEGGTEFSAVGQERVDEIPGADPPAVLTRFTGYLLRRVFAQFSADTNVGGVDLRDLSVMEALAERDWISQLDLAGALDINRTIMVSLLGRMEELGWVARNRNPQNRRSYLLSLTDSGRGALKEMRQQVAERDLSLTARLSGQERARLRELLTALVSQPQAGVSAHSIEALIAQAHQRHFKLGKDLLANSGLHMRYLAPLSALTSLAPCAQQELAQFLAITEPAAAELVDDLVRAGFVERGRDRQDRRRYALELTDKGRRALDGLLEAGARQQADSVSLLGERGADDLRHLLLKLLDLSGRSADEGR
jgi:DNA-binding MarR family transcriptional regulator